jgi:hypothetical protein
MQPWEALAERAFAILAKADAELFWTMGGGTVLMLRHNHRASKDVDIFLRDPQALGYVNPRMGGIAEQMTVKYEEGAEHVKLHFPEGEVDFVASPLLTAPGFVDSEVLGRAVRLETDVEIVAKKLWHRGNEAKARDLFDLCLVIERSPDNLRQAAKYLTRHRAAFLDRMQLRRDILRAQFESIDVRDYRPSFDRSVDLASSFLMALP